MSSRPAENSGTLEQASSLDQDLRAAPLVAGRYRLKRVIARGGMGMVYLAEHAQLRRPVALKVLTPPPGSDDDGSFQKRFQLEAETLAALDHPNIVTLFDYGQMEDGRYFLAMEYIEGPRFTDIVRDGPLSPDRALRLLLQVCAALRYAHRRTLVHRDLKPSNLLIRLDDEGNEQVKVVDFGLVKVAEADQSLTKAGHVLGSPHCMSPEQVNGGDVDARADIYALGVLLFRSVSGAYPFHGSTAAATMIAHVKEPTPALASVAPDLAVPPGLEALIQRCLAKAPEERYQSVDELIRDMAACLNVPVDQFQSVSISQSSLQKSPLALSEAEIDLPEPEPRSNRALLIILALLALIVAGMTALLLIPMLGDTAPPPPATTAAPEPPPAVPAAPPAPEAAPPAAAATPDAAPAGTPPVASPEAPAAPATTTGKNQGTKRQSGGTRPEQSAPTTTKQDGKKDAPDGYLGLPEDF